ncbi:hypothetical protein D8Y20_05250 [Mariprofundus sp. EBB-1]|uniref:hypothetical protein n=1 Tax=Mariprofundus sp. EBB-1 TaxID=2650971 RepID=UPI000EF1C514|nr:hypothetical protein [Mariprofundus sp. EBB-1]RLL53576.1 hypothetical protein D8Y20_05250 [Mariprofundus sp. EBB-1]
MPDSSHTPQPPFDNADAWRNAAMQRTSLCDAAESDQRKILADVHNQKEGICDPDVLADQMLYILGKMDVDEYQNYLLFKHTPAS